MYYLGADSKRVYTLKVRAARCIPSTARRAGSGCDAHVHLPLAMLSYTTLCHLRRSWTLRATRRSLPTQVSTPMARGWQMHEQISDLA
jgi:hypothetical protein